MFEKQPAWNTSLPLGPNSLTWKHFGDIRSMLILGRAGTLQNMHPVLDAALQEHSNFFSDPMDRFDRSVAPIQAMIYEPDPQARAQKVRDFHKPIKGVAPQGNRYHALDPEVFWWTHVTFYESIIATQEFFGTPFTESEKAQLVAEGLTWWRLYGMSDRPAFGDYASYQAYWTHMWTEVLESNKTTTFAATIHQAKVPAPPFIPNTLWPLIRYPIMSIGVWISNATMPPEARKILGWKWSRTDQLAFELFRRTIRTTWHLTPERLRYIPDAWSGMQQYRNHPDRFEAPEVPESIPATN